METVKRLASDQEFTINAFDAEVVDQHQWYVKKIKEKRYIVNESGQSIGAFLQGFTPVFYRDGDTFNATRENLSATRPKTSIKFKPKEVTLQWYERATTSLMLSLQWAREHGAEWEDAIRYGHVKCRDAIERKALGMDKIRSLPPNRVETVLTKVGADFAGIPTRPVGVLGRIRTDLDASKVGADMSPKQRAKLGLPLTEEEQRELEESKKTMRQRQDEERERSRRERGLRGNG